MTPIWEQSIEARIAAAQVRLAAMCEDHRRR